MRAEAISGREQRPPVIRVARNTVLRALADMLGKVASLALFAFIARGLGASTLGDYVFALSVAQLVWSAAGFGLDQMALRDIARQPAKVNRLFFDLISFKLIVGVAGIAVSTAAVAALGYGGEVVALVALLGFAVLLALLTETAQTVFQAYERMEYYFLTYLPNKLLAALFGIGVLIAGAGIVAVAAGALVAAAIGLVVGTFLVYRFFARLRARISPRAVPRLARVAAPWGIQEISGLVVYRADVVILSLLTTSAVVGIYGAAYRLLEATFFLAWSVGQSVLPMFSYLDRDSNPSLDRVFEGSLKFLVVLMTPIAVTLLVCAEPVIDLFFGLPEYADAVPVLRWLSFATLLYALANLGIMFVLVHIRGRVIVGVFVGAALFTVLLSVALIIPLEAQGAAIATLASELVILVVVLALALRVVGPPRWLSVAGGAAAAGIAMALAMLPLADRLWLALPAGLAAYLGVLLAFEARHVHGDIEAVREVMRLRRRPAAPAASIEQPPRPA